MKDSKYIKDVGFLSTSEELYKDYSVEVIEDRAIFCTIDGLKPVTRRALWAAHRLGLRAGARRLKAAKVVGDTMGDYHPHGDCLAGDTLVPLTDGSYKTISDLTRIGKPQEVFVFDKATKKVKAAIAHSFRVGQVTKNAMRITLLSGESFIVTKNHPFSIGSKWIKAENITPGQSITALHATDTDYQTFISQFASKTHTSAHKVVAKYLSKLKYDSSYQVIHHCDENKRNNSSNNFKILPRPEHSLAHKDYLEGLKNGREAMFSKSGLFFKATKKKNILLAKEMNKKLWLVKACTAVSLLIERNIEISASTYENLRNEGVIYNLTHFNTLVSRGESFEKIKGYIKYKEKHGKFPFFDSSAAVGHTRSIRQSRKLHKEKKKVELFNRKVMKIAYKVMKLILRSGQSITNKTYDKYVPYIIMDKYNRKRMTSGSAKTLCAYFGESSIIKSLKHFDKDFLSIVVEVETLTFPIAKEMFDFTVDGYENMFVTNNEKQWICVHNSSIYNAIVTANSLPIPLFSGQGNWGTMTDPPAAMRYTETRLSKYSDKVFFDPFYLPVMASVKNYDDSKDEPFVLNALLPNALLNGNFGIAPGVRTETPSFTLKSLCKVIVETLKAGTCTPAMCLPLEFTTPLGGVMRQYKGIKKDLLAFYRDGVGRFIFDSTFETVSKNHIRFNRFAPISSVGNVLQKISAMKGIQRTTDESNKKDKYNAYGVIGKINDSKVLRNVVDAFSAPVNFDVKVTERILNEENPNGKKSLLPTNVPDMINTWIRYRIDLEKRACSYWAERRLEDIRYQELMRIAVANRKLIIQALDKPFTDEQLADFIAKKLKITVDEANKILDLKVRQLKALEDKKLIAKIKELRAEVAGYKDRIAKPKRYIATQVVEIFQGLQKEVEA